MIIKCCKEHQSTSYVVSMVMLHIQKQGCVDVNHDANTITFSSGNSSIALCFNILLESLLIEPILGLPDCMDQ